MNIARTLSLLLMVFTVSESFAQHVSAEALKPFEFMTGEWNVEVDARLSKNGPWEKSKGHSVITKRVGGSVIQEEFTGTRQGREFIAVAMITNDNRTKLYQKLFVDSDHGVLVMYEGKLEDKFLNVYHELTLNDSKVILRSQYHLVSENSFTVESARSTDNGATWDRTGTTTYTRK